MMDMDTEGMKKKTPITGFVAGNKTLLLLQDASMINELFLQKKNNFDKHLDNYKSVTTEYGENILVSKDGGTWKKHRSFANSAFGKEKLNYVARISVEETEAMMEYIKKKTQSFKESFDMAAHIHKLTLGVISQAAWGEPLTLFDEKKKTLQKNHTFTLYETSKVETFEAIIYKALVPKWVDSLLQRLPFKNPGRYFSKAHTEMFDYLKEFLRRRKLSIEKGDDVPDDLLTHYARGQQDTILSEDEVLSNLHVFLLAGHETTASSMGFTLYHLAQQPALQQRIFEEVSALKGKPTLDDYIKGSLDFTKCCAKESLRLHPVAHVVPKMCTKTCKLTSDDGVSYKIRKGEHTFVNVTGVHHSPKYWGDDVMSYRPSRWNEKVVSGAYCPFSLGRRKCIGFEFSYIESVMILATLVRGYTFSLDSCYGPSEPPRPGFGLTRVIESCKLRFKKRSFDD
eukprot:CAMPEP_0117423214 /NCGR_PEP_ID=MMETSP0758-20121206/3888_1 /TAXON_ID=63605 /ORGANISM="Percolomonas cosmopolitus, Strain AE-1 (ATCC 50343)" /LENGTH=453 /DNA_ID=CAMNT_0005206279 /DNA_START=462 /DNA_END=1823 /DNA_ORIENTATION=+